jgi:hypothetical protein
MKLEVNKTDLNIMGIPFDDGRDFRGVWHALSTKANRNTGTAGITDPRQTANLLCEWEPSKAALLWNARYGFPS